MVVIASSGASNVFAQLYNLKYLQLDPWSLVSMCPILLHAQRNIFILHDIQTLPVHGPPQVR